MCNQRRVLGSEQNSVGIDTVRHLNVCNNCIVVKLLKAEVKMYQNTIAGTYIIGTAESIWLAKYDFLIVS